MIQLHKTDSDFRKISGEVLRPIRDPHTTVDGARPIGDPTVKIRRLDWQTKPSKILKNRPRAHIQLQLIQFASHP